jgi:hypothetical protein
MTVARGLAEQFESPGDQQPERDGVVDPPETIQPVIAVEEHVPALQATIEALRIDNEMLRAKLAARDEAVWLPLKAAAIDASLPYETARAWAAAGLIESDRDGGRIFVNATNLFDRLKRLGRR